MASEVIAAIKKAEEEAQDILKEAQSKARDVVSSVSEQLKEREAQAVQEAQAKAKDIVGKAQEGARMNSELRLAQNEKACEEIRESAKNNSAQARDYILKNLG